MGTVADWLFPQVRNRVLALLLGHPEQRWHLREIARQAGFAVGTVRRELAGLTQAEIVTRTREGNRTYYQANRQSSVYPDLAGLLRKTAGIVDVLGEALSPLAETIAVAFVYGSVAAGTERSASDVDLLIVGEVSFGDAAAALASAQERLGREVNPTVFPPEEFAQRLAESDHFVRTVLDGPKLLVIGTERDLERVAAKGLAD